MAVTKRYTIDLIESFQIITDAQIHPDASCVAFAVSGMTHARDKSPRANIWLADTDGSNTRALTHADACEMHPRWSPDGKTLAFTSDRASTGNFQIFLLPRDGGEARQLTHGSTINPPYRDVSMFKWSPDGTRIAYLVQDAPDPRANARRAQGFDEIEFETQPRFTRVQIVQVATGKTHVVTRGDVQAWEFNWSPRGDELIVLCSAQPYEWSWYDPWLARVPARGGIPRKIFARPARQLAHPRWSPDGQHIAFISSLWSDRGITSGDLYVMDVYGKNARVLSQDFNGSLSHSEWTNAQTLIATGYVEGQPALTQFDLQGARNVLWQGSGALHEGSMPRFSRAQDGTIAVVHSAPDQPRQVWTIQPGADAVILNQITDLNPEYKQLATGIHEIIFWTGHDGQEMQGILVKPLNAKPGKPLPLIVHPHGGPTGLSTNEYFSPGRWVYHLTQRGYAVFMPNFRGSTGWGIEFAQANLGDMGGSDFQDIMRGVDALIERGIADPKRMGFGGWSYGGYLTAWAITQTNRFRAAIAGAAIVNWLSFHGSSYLCRWDELHYDASPYEHGGVYDKFTPMNFIANATTPTLILHGEKDGDVPVSQGYELFRALKDKGVETEMVVYPREPHGIGETQHVRDLIARVCDWYDKHLK